MILVCPICQEIYDADTRYDARNVEVWLICSRGHEYGVRIKHPHEEPGGKIVREEEIGGKAD